VGSLNICVSNENQGRVYDFFRDCMSFLSDERNSFLGMTMYLPIIWQIFSVKYVNTGEWHERCSEWW
jgi:hypothetical protein